MKYDKERNKLGGIDLAQLTEESRKAFINSFKKDLVNHPKHYNTGKYEVKDVIRDWDLNFALGSAIKYIARCNHKSNKKEDLEKAIFFLKDEIENMEVRND